MKNRVFFTGAGFSKALCPSFPTLNELSASVVNCFVARNRSGAIRQHFDQLPMGMAQNVEQLLSYLHSDWPWKSSVDKDLDSALFKALIYEISVVLTAIKIQPLSTSYEILVKFLDAAENRIITLNYDSLLADLHSAYVVSKYHKHGPIKAFVEDDFYGQHITSSKNPWVLERETSDASRHRYLLTFHRDYITDVSPEEFEKLIFSVAGKYWTSNSPKGWLLSSLKSNLEPRVGYSQETSLFNDRILKLHGATTWHNDSSDSTIRVLDGDGNMTMVRIPIIVPPIMDKSRHYSIGRLKDAWVSAHSSLEKADEIIIIGFSFPPTDISCQFLFQSALKGSKDTRVIVINPDISIRERYDSVFQGLSGVNIDYRYTGLGDSLGAFIEQEIYAASNVVDSER